MKRMNIKPLRPFLWLVCLLFGVVLMPLCLVVPLELVNVLLLLSLAFIVSGIILYVWAQRRKGGY